ncbi:hypothetical protein Xmau_02930 [Xenorhabdus mauleonii]|uniref:Uncharacterized protein n=1 Tax=Xenorhabdus mauleonii TaxID=351675 RepID=A0A1I3TD73_9GAMM|nr:hypothetical protein Xmau_02930 [Xenorhabdus mauleonii]SFJ67681.1 hypothetical protein SAMN05421680_11353 [Xenorhabdus mauleonii]
MRTGAVWVIGISAVFYVAFLLSAFATFVHLGHRFYQYTVIYAPSNY